MANDPNISETIPTNSLLELIVGNDFSVSVQIHGYWLVAGLLLLLIVLATKLLLSKSIRSLELDEAELGIGSQKIKLRPNDTDSQIAYKIWVELSTRKIGIPIELEKDVISEIYNSWYEFFGVTRELLKEIPASKMKRSDTKKIVNLSIEVLNTGTRPHLTEWQAKFRRWYEKQLTIEVNTEKSPQDIQLAYPSYSELSSDLIAVNKKLIKYRENMYAIVVGES